MTSNRSDMPVHEHGVSLVPSLYNMVDFYWAKILASHPSRLGSSKRAMSLHQAVLARMTSWSVCETRGKHWATRNLSLLRNSNINLSSATRGNLTNSQSSEGPPNRVGETQELQRRPSVVIQGIEVNDFHSVPSRKETLQ